MSDLTAALGHKIGPLPAGAWAAAIGGGLGIALLIRNRASSSDTATGADPLLSTTAGMGGAAVSDPANPGNISDPVDADSAGDATAPGITTNAQWRDQAIKYGIAHGGHGAIYVGNVVGHYLSGASISAAGAVLINTIVAGIGPPPAAVPRTTVRPAPKPKPAPKPPKPKPTRQPKPPKPKHPAHHPAPKPAPHPKPKPPKHGHAAVHHTAATHAKTTHTGPSRRDDGKL